MLAQKLADSFSVTLVPSLHRFRDFDSHEAVYCCRDINSGLIAYIAIHNTALGKALGGCRMWDYASDDDAITDALRLSQGMTYKHAIAGTNMGGGKAVIIGKPTDKSPELLRSFARFVDALHGMYVTAEDVGIGVPDVVQMNAETQHIAGLPVEMGGSGNPSPFTAYGVFCGIQASLAYRQGNAFAENASMAGTKVLVQGLGNVGFSLCKHLHSVGAELLVCDPVESRVAEAMSKFKATSVALEDVYETPTDVYAPCALGGTLTEQSIASIPCQVVAGAANNQLATPEVEQLLHQKGIMYAPDFVINAGGIINISYENRGYNANLAWEQTRQIGHTLTRVFETADAESIMPGQAALRIAQEKLAAPAGVPQTEKLHN